jgi:hypothetical protein
LIKGVVDAVAACSTDGAELPVDGAVVDAVGAETLVDVANAARFVGAAPGAVDGGAVAINDGASVPAVLVARAG